MNSLLLTVLGIDPKVARYSLGGSSVEATLAPLALVQLLPPARRPDRIRALCTPEAEQETFPLLRDGCIDLGIANVEAIRVDADAVDLRAFRSAVEAACPRNEPLGEILVDTTHGFRHLSVLTYLAAQYLSVLREIRLGGFYGLLRRDQESPFIDLGPVLSQMEWIHALRIFRDAGDARPLARRIEATGRQDARTIARELEEISEARETGLPLELGRACRSFLDVHRRPLSRNLGLAEAPFADELEELLLEPLKRFCLADPAAARARAKTAIVLDEDEIRRQERLVDDLLERGRTATAVGVMNELVVSRVVLAHGWRTAWLDFHEVRRRAAAALDSLRVEGCARNETQRRIGRFWQALSQARNAFHHHGYRRGILLGKDANDFTPAVRFLRKEWSWIKSLPALDLRVPTAFRRLLVSPVGLRPGVLYSALRACREPEADACLALVSAETEAGAREACARAGFAGTLEALVVHRPLDGSAEIRELAHQARPFLLQAEEVSVNLTGGTTLMGLAVARIAEDARGLGRPVRRFGLVDERSEAAQAEDPFRAGTPFWLDGVDADGH
jgi:CRISPR-associated DxTHG motif protein